jgi:hypothetical protein
MLWLFIRFVGHPGFIQHRLLKFEPIRDVVASYGDQCLVKLPMVPSRLAPFSKKCETVPPRLHISDPRVIEV